MSGGERKLGAKYFSALYNSPFGNEFLAEFAKTCVKSESLGARADPGLLVVSFSSNDAVGHTWGPNSQEVLDVSIRADFVVANLLRFLDANVGAGQYSVVVTADHGVCPMPEVSKGQDIEAKRVPFVNVVRGAELFLDERYGKGANPLSGGKKAPQWLESVDPPFIYLNARLIEAKRLDREAVARALGEWMQTQEGIARTFTRGQLAGEFAPDDDLAQRMRKSFHPDRCGDLAFVIEPYHLLGSGTGTTHGTPYPTIPTFRCWPTARASWAGGVRKPSFPNRRRSSPPTFWGYRHGTASMPCRRRCTGSSRSQSTVRNSTPPRAQRSSQTVGSYHDGCTTRLRSGNGPACRPYRCGRPIVALFRRPPSALGPRTISVRPPPPRDARWG